jgi:hypothetical protein
VLKAVVVNGVHRHSISALLEYRGQHRSKHVDEGFDGNVAADAFTSFDQGLGPADVVRELRITPQAARTLHREWADLKASLVVGSESVAEIEKLAVACDEGPIETGDDLARLLDILLATQCRVCQKRTATFCMNCYVHRPALARQLVRAAIARSDAREEKRHRLEMRRQVAARAANKRRDSIARVP